MTSLPSQPPAFAMPSPPRPSRWKSWLLALLIFFGGLAVGAGVTVVVAVRSLQHVIQHPEEAPARITLRLTRRLSLTPQQAARVQAIVVARQRALGRIRRTQVETQLAQLESQIADVLTPTQRNAWQTMVVNLRRNWLPPTPGAEGADSDPNLVPN